MAYTKIPDYPNYSIDKLGNVRNDNYRNQGYERKLTPTYYNAFYVRLTNEHGPKNLLVSRLMAHTFLNNPLFTNGQDNIVHHKNGDNKDNRLENLSIITHRENMSVERTLKSGLPTGVSQLPSGRYRSRITYNGKAKNLGVYSTIDQASEAYKKALTNVHNYRTN